MKVKNIAILDGDKTTVRDGAVHYNPTFIDVKSDDAEKKEKKPISALVRTDVVFSQGTVSYKFKATEKHAGVLLTIDSDNKHIFSAGLSHGNKAFRIFDARSNKIIRKGSLDKFKTNQEVQVRFEAVGSNTRLYVNNVLYCELEVTLRPAPLTFRITSSGKVILYDINVELSRPRLFVVMQFTDEFNNLYTDVIKPVAEKAGFDVIRADEFYASTPILNDIVRSIQEASVIIAEITPNNPNVFYEIGYAHAINKPTILICDRKREKLPFDISSFRTLFYENSIAGKAKIESSLDKYLENILTNDI